MDNFNAKDKTIIIMSEFHKNLINFLDELIEQFPHNKYFLTARIHVKDVIPVIDIINFFIQHILPHKEHITKRDADFFMNNSDLFSKNLDGKKLNQKDIINDFKKLWRSNALDKEDRQVLWKWVDSFVFLLEKYILAIQPKEINE